MSKLRVIYITGLGDRNPKSQRRAVALWRWYGVEPEFFQVNWGDKEPWEPKFKRLLARIDKLSKGKNKVALVSVSAGASAAINAFAARQDKVVGIVCISGKIHRPENIGANYRKSNPAFVTSAYSAPRSLASLNKSARARILCRYGLVDEIVTPKDSRIEGARNQQSPTISHFVTIAYQITIGARSLLKFLKRLT